jgi:hypothetical protein
VKVHLADLAGFDQGSATLLVMVMELRNADCGIPGMILGAKFRSWANFPWFFPKKDSLFSK